MKRLGLTSHTRPLCVYGPVLRELPSGFVPRQQWPEYVLETDAPLFMRPWLVGQNPQGLRRGIGPLIMEEYISDDAPDIHLSDATHAAPPRILIWQRVHTTMTLPGWHTLSRRPGKLEGFKELIPGTPYTNQWSVSALRYLKKWRTEQLGTHYTIEPVSYDEFARAYEHGTVVQRIGRTLIHTLGRKIMVDGGNSAITLWAARNKSTGAIDAGLATITSTTHRSSYYHTGFVCARAAHTNAMVGLMDHWFTTCEAQRVRFVCFGQFWRAGDPSSWKGFSAFKSKFGLQYLAYPPALYRFSWGTML